MIQRTISEWECIYYGSGKGEIPVTHADRIAATVRNTKFSGLRGEGVLEHRRNSLRARGVVGVIATPECQLEILPKIESRRESDVTNDQLRDRLIYILAAVYDLPIEIGAKASLGLQRNTILEILIRKFCEMLIDAVRRGMPRRYIEHQDDLPALRGRLNSTRQFSILAASPQKLACSYDALSSDIPLNQVMLAAVSKLSRLTGAEDNQRMLRELSFVYADVADIPVSELRWDLVSFGRTNNRWRDLYNMARMFLLDRHQRTTAGETDGYALLFEMNVLFELYVARMLSSALSGTNLHVSAQRGHRYCVYELDKTPRFRTKPDLIIRRGEEIVLVVDTKWKRITPHIDDAKRGVSQADVYQMMAYCQLYDSSNVVLLYPHNADLLPEQICQPYTIASSNSDEKLFLATLDLSGQQIDHQNDLKDMIFSCIGDSKGALESCE